MDNELFTHDMGKLTDRQKREKEFYETYTGILNIDDVCFDPVDGKEKRPWNSYWYVYDLVIRLFDKDRNRLLDFGCGTGETSVRFAKIGYEISGFDISERSLTLASNLALKYGFSDQTDFSLQVAENLNYPSDYFDVIVGFDILHHVDIKSAIKECKRVLKKDGIAIFREPVEAPVLDYMRNTRLIRFFIPNEKNYTPGRHITEDERKLDKKDIETIKGIFGNIKEERFTLIARFDLFFRKFYKGASPLEKMDRLIFNVFPLTKRFGGDAVLILKK